MGRIFTILILVFLVSCTVNHNKPKSVNDEFSYRYEKVYNRLTGTEYSPVYTEEFILADINLNPERPRSSDNYSGDLSGRYIQAMSHAVKPRDEEFLKRIVHNAISFQKKDGRFGNANLDFSKELTADHMALLWGNGRMLCGLTAYYSRFPDPEILDAMRKLGNFYLTTVENCAKPENVKKLTPFGASGIIGFTGIIEALVSLTQITGDQIYAQAALRVYPILPPRGQQHSHGYLTTLRGVMKLYEYYHDEKLLKYVQDKYDDLIRSDDYTIMGGVTEYFGGRDRETRDEGCSQTDFIRLSLDLYHATWELKYLDKAEYAIYNALYFNQYCTGDFGHHSLVEESIRFYSEDKSKKSLKYLEAIRPNFNMAAWWCCDMSGLLTMDIIKKDFILYNRKQGIVLNLFLECKIGNDDFTAYIENGGFHNNKHWYILSIDDLREKQTLKIRIPNWVNEISIKRNENEVNYVKENEYAIIEPQVFSGDKIEIGFEFKIRLKDIYGNTIPMDYDKTEVGCYLLYGPFLMGVDDNVDPTFLAEPNNNVVYLNSIQPVDTAFNSPVVQNTFSHQYTLKANYKHEGFQGIQTAFFRPLNSGAMEKSPYVRFLNEFVNKSFSIPHKDPI